MQRISELITLALAAMLARDYPKEAQEAFEKATEFELYSLDPSKEVKDGFHGWTILGKTAIKGEDVKKVREAVEKGRKDSYAGLSL